VTEHASLQNEELVLEGSGKRDRGGGTVLDLDPDAQSQELDRHLQSTAAHRELLQRLSADVIARRRTLPEAASVLVEFALQSKPEWLRGVGRLYLNRSELAVATLKELLASDSEAIRLQAPQ
jgi:hypothetical protein